MEEYAGIVAATQGSLQFFVALRWTGRTAAGSLTR
jgi:hypothetical protein